MTTYLALNSAPVVVLEDGVEKVRGFIHTRYSSDLYISMYHLFQQFADTNHLLF